MAVTAADLIDPAGRILLDMFPGETSGEVTTRVDGWIDQAGADAEIAAAGDAAVQAYVYTRAFSAVCDRLNVQAARLDFADQGGRQMLKEQLAYWQAERDSMRAELESILAAADAENDDVVTGAPLPSSYSAIQFVL